MTAVDRYNALDGQTVKREELQKIAVLGAKQGQTKISLKLFKLLEENDNEEFKIKLSQYELDKLAEEDLPGLEYAAPDEEFEGLQKAVSPDEIYQYITDLMINTIKEVGDLPWQREWDKTALFNGYQATNFESKKGYRGINFMLLNFEVKIINGVHTLVPKNWENPYFLTFNQIEKNKGQLTKGSKGKRVIYFTQLYTHSERNKKNEVIFDYSTYNKKKFAAWAKKNQYRIHVIKSGLRSLENFIESSYLPILKYYNVFNGEDITGIDWGTLPKNENVDKPEKQRIEIAEKIIELYPNKPQIIYKGDQPAYYPLQDQILMTPIEAFKNEQSYYCTLFHECIHSTGHSSRLKRGLGASKKGDASYAFEELIAELGAVFLSAESGILFQVRDNSAKYLKGWNSRLVKAMKDDNRFFFRASSKAQAGSDYILDRNKNGVPAYQNSKSSGSTKNISPEKKTGKKNSKKPTTNDLLGKQKSAKLTAKNKGEFEKGLKKLGFEIFSYESDQVNPKEWERTYKLNFKDVTGLELKMDVLPEGKEITGEYSWKAFGIDTDSSIDYENLQQFYEEILAEFKEVFAKASLTELDGLRKEYSKTLHKNKEPKTQLGLFGADGRISISTDALKEMKVSDLRKFTLEYYNHFLKGDHTAIKNSLKKVDFVTNAGKKIARGGAMYSEKAAVMEQLKNLIEKSTYNNWGEKKNEKDNILLGYLNFKSKLVINGEQRHVRISIALKKDGKTELKNFDVGKIKNGKKSSKGRKKHVPQVGEDSLPSTGKDKKKSNSKKKGLKNPGEIAVATVKPISQNIAIKDEKEISNSLAPIIPIEVQNGVTPILSDPEKALSKKTSKVRNLADRREEKEPVFFNVPGEIGKFFQAVERKEEESVVITMDGQQGAGKTTTLYKAMDAFASGKNKGIFFSLEEHYTSSLAKDKRDKYLSVENQAYLDIISDLDSKQEFYDLIEDYEIIFIDSWQKLLTIVGNNFRLDTDLRKRFDGKVFVIIFQQTTDGKTRGGAQIVFDGDMIMKMIKEDRFSDNYAYWDKNRYTKVPLETIRYNIAGGFVYNPEETTDVSDINFEEVNQDPINSSSQIPESGRLIATPVI